MNINIVEKKTLYELGIENNSVISVTFKYVGLPRKR